MTENEIGRVVVDEAVKLHRILGPGLLESVYELVLVQRLSVHGMEVARQVAVPIEVEGVHFETGFRADIIVEGKVLLELKSVERLCPAHRKQIQTYLRLSGHKLGFLLNFGAPVMKEGLVRCVNGLPEP